MRSIGNVNPDTVRAQYSMSQDKMLMSEIDDRSINKMTKSIDKATKLTANLFD